MFGFLGNLLGNAASYIAGGQQPTTQQGQWNIDNAGGDWGDSPEEKERKRRQKLIQDRARAQQGKMPLGTQAPAQQHQRQPHAQWQAQQAPWQHPLAEAHFGAQKDMFAATSNAIQNEMDSRVQQASEERDRQHEYEMELLKQQGASDRAQQSVGPARGRQRVTTSIRNGVKTVEVTPIGRSLLD